jgi:hypothetical protein
MLSPAPRDCSRFLEGFVNDCLPASSALIGEPLRDDLIDFRRKAQAQVSHADFNVFHVDPVVVDAGFPRDNGVGA